MINVSTVVLIFSMSDDPRPSTPELKIVSLYDDQKEEYYTKILQARNLFRIEPKIKDPFYVVRFGADYYNAFYDLDFKSVIINEKMVRDFSLEELSAIIAHEFAHAEVMEVSGRETRQHWQVDVRGAELTNPAWMEAALLRLKSQYSKSTPDLTWFESYPRTFKLALYIIKQPMLGENQFKDRLEHIRNMKRN